ncbi:phage integrase Arm DNA-binding domain-containing protein [Burkholderia pyrrocinia]|nr:phage integrase Arm DNA-binding domain-containing protein [Burkholderia pyrrocinia]QVN19425.1 phage integrase Arm DNA-binding domain-containing protein [Burkholderia pyrrocinia]
MAARPRIRQRANWPDNLYMPRDGYYTWRDSRDGKTHISRPHAATAGDI